MKNLLLIGVVLLASCGTHFTAEQNKLYLNYHPEDHRSVMNPDRVPVEAEFLKLYRKESWLNSKCKTGESAYEDSSSPLTDTVTVGCYVFVVDNNSQPHMEEAMWTYYDKPSWWND